MTTDTTTTAPATLAHWEPHELEWLSACPLCNFGTSTVLHEGLQDYIFMAAGGQWRLMSCSACDCAFLNPRPTATTIGRAYASYYTHGAVAASGAALSGRAWLRRALANGYRNALYGTQLRPSLGVVGIATARLSRAFRNAIEGEAPGLVRVRPTQAGQSLILDVGCGSGLSLLRARDAGWRVMGIEPDEEAVRAANARGIEIVAHHLHELPASFDGTFERIMLSHVIEHVHDPIAMLSRCKQLLAPGGTLWLETPNLSSVGYEEFGADWRGLEPPRHLVMFRRAPLDALLQRAGFANIRHSKPREVWSYLFERSVETRQQRLRLTVPAAAASASAAARATDEGETLHQRMQRARDIVEKNPERAEFLTLTATA